MKTKTKTKNRCTKKIIVDFGDYGIGPDNYYSFRLHPCTFLASGKSERVGIDQISLNYNEVSFKKIPDNDLETVYRLLAGNGDGKLPWLPIAGLFVHFRDSRKDRIIRKIRRPDGY